MLGTSFRFRRNNAPSQEAVNDALTFLDGRPGDIPLPYPEEGTEGDVGVYWDIRHAHVFAEVTFEGDGTFAYFAVHGVPGAVAEKCGNDGVDAADPWPDELPRDSSTVPTFHSNRQRPETAARQLDYVFASTELADSLRVRALNAPEEWGPSDHCRVEIELPDGA